jgi:hypothetical protein
MIWGIYILFSLLYLGIFIYFLITKSNIIDTTSKNSELTDDEKLNVIAMPKMFTIKIHDHEENTDLKKYVDIAINIKDLLRQLDKKDNLKEIEIEHEKVFLKDVNLNEYEKNLF